MKKTILLAAFAATAFVSCEKETDSIPPAPVSNTTKTIHFSISQGTDYSNERYDGLTATLNIHVVKVSKKDGREVNLWDTAIVNQSIREYPLPHQPFSFNKKFYGINDDEEGISVSHWTSYRTGNNEQYAEGKNQYVPTGNSNLNFPVKL